MLYAAMDRRFQEKGGFESSIDRLPARFAPEAGAEVHGSSGVS